MKTEQFAVRTPNLLTPDTTSINVYENQVDVVYEIPDAVRSVSVFALKRQPGYFILLFRREIDDTIRALVDSGRLSGDESISEDGIWFETTLKISSEGLDALNILTSVACEKLSDKFLKSK